MRHHKQGRKFHRTSGQRRSFLRNLGNDLIRVGRIETTDARAKEIRPIVERLVTLAKKQDIAHRRIILARVGNARVTKKLFEEIGPKYLNRAGGYLRIIKSAKSRKRDGGKLAIIEFV